MTTEPRNPHIEHLEEVPLPGSPVSKLQAVRDYLAAHPRATDEEIVAALAKRGISIPDDYPASVRAQGQESEAEHEQESVVEALQSILAQHGKTSPEALAAALKARGFNVTPAYAESLRAAIQHS